MLPVHNENLDRNVTSLQFPHTSLYLSGKRRVSSAQALVIMLLTLPTF
jgi:hypothetical protein